VKVRANEVWEGIGADMGFDPKTVEPIRGTQKYTAIPLPDADPEADAAPMGANGKPEVLRRLGDLLDEALRRAEARRAGHEKPVAVPWPELGEQLGGGLWPGLHVFVGGTGTGKSTMALQIALEAARKGTPAGYVGLELGELDVALRVLGEQAGVSWSRLYTGRASEGDVRRAADAKSALEGLPFYVELGRPTGWPASELEALAERMRRAHPEAKPGALPMLLVLDFLQIVGDEPEQHAELRERIGRAAYFARDVARRLNVAVLAVSSAARDKYGALAGAALYEAGLGLDHGRRFVTLPDVLVGMGKESGELEYSADSVTVAVRGPKLGTADGHERCVVLVTAKGRATGAGWCALRFEKGQRFTAWDGSAKEVLEALEEERKKPKPPKTADDAKGTTIPDGIG
jgi:replicative DNA helicase